MDGVFWFLNILHVLFLQPKEDPMKYRNKKTGAVIDTSTCVHGNDWEDITPSSVPVSKSKVAPVQPKRKAVKKSE